MIVAIVMTVAIVIDIIDTAVFVLLAVAASKIGIGTSGCFRSPLQVQMAAMKRTQDYRCQRQHHAAAILPRPLLLPYFWA